MPNLNKVLLMGNLTRDPELRYTPSNTPVVKIGLAVNRRWRNQQGEQQEEVTFVDCDGFGKTAEAINQYMKKGRPIFIEGRLRLDQWQDKEGNKRSKMGVIIENFQFIDSRGAAGGTGGPGGDEGGAAPTRPAPQRNTPQRTGPQGGPQGAPAASNTPPAHEAMGDEDIPF